MPSKSLKAAILELLDNHPKRYFTALEVRQTINRTNDMHQDASVMLSHLMQLAEEDKIERTPMNHFRRKAKPKHVPHLAPHIAEILRRSGKTFGGIVE